MQLGSHFSSLVRGLVCFALVSLVLQGQAQLITRRVTVQPIQMVSNDGSDKANPSLTIFEDATDKIWAQGGIDFLFLEPVSFTNTAYLNPSSSVFSGNSVLSLAKDPGHGQHSNPDVINLWFVKTIDGSASVYGYSLQSTYEFDVLNQQNGVTIADSAFSYGGSGMLDIFAYEIGRNLGLDQGLHGQPSDPVNLMKPSGPFPTSLSQIHPDGAGYGHLTTDQVNAAKLTSFVKNLDPSEYYYYNAVPEPGLAASAAAALLLGVGVVRRLLLAGSPDEGKKRLRSRT